MSTPIEWEIDAVHDEERDALEARMDADRLHHIERAAELGR